MSSIGKRVLETTLPKNNWATKCAIEASPLADYHNDEAYSKSQQAQYERYIQWVREMKQGFMQQQLHPTEEETKEKEVIMDIMEEMKKKEETPCKGM